MIPCSEAEKEAEPVSIPMSTIIDAPVECLWDKIDAWGTDHTWVQGAQVHREQSAQTKGNYSLDCCQQAPESIHEMMALSRSSLTPAVVVSTPMNLTERLLQMLRASHQLLEGGSVKQLPANLIAC